MMSTTPNRPRPQWITGLAVLAFLASGLVGFVLGFGFVQSAGGSLITGLAAGLCGALFCSLLADALLARLGGRRGS